MTSSWNYRVIKHPTYVAMHEVHYNAKGQPTMWTENPVTLSAETSEELAEVYAMMARALTDPVLNEEDIDFFHD